MIKEVKSSCSSSYPPLITRQGMSWKKRSLIICKVSENWSSRAAGHNFLQLSTMNKTFGKSHNFRCLISDWLLITLHNNFTRLRKHIAKIGKSALKMDNVYSLVLNTSRRILIQERLNLQQNTLWSWIQVTGLLFKTHFPQILLFQPGLFCHVYNSNLVLDLALLLQSKNDCHCHINI